MKREAAELVTRAYGAGAFSLSGLPGRKARPSGKRTRLDILRRPKYFRPIPDDNDEPRPEPEAAAALEEARRLARAFRRHMPEGEKRLFDEVLAKAGPFIRTLTLNPETSAARRLQPPGTLMPVSSR